MTTRLGGSSSPRLPVDVSRPIENRSENPSLINTGSSKPPNARMVTPEAPVNVVKKAHKMVAATAEPPGIQPKQARKTRTRRSDALLSERIKPARVKIGMVGNTLEVTIR